MDFAQRPALRDRRGRFSPRGIIQLFLNFELGGGESRRIGALDVNRSGNLSTAASSATLVNGASGSNSAATTNAGGKLLQDLQPLAGNLGGLGVKTGNAE
jgi:hypothetical protein